MTDGTGTMLAGMPVCSAQAAILQNPSAILAYATTLTVLVIGGDALAKLDGNIGAAPVYGNPSTAPVTLGLYHRFLECVGGE